MSSMDIDELKAWLRFSMEPGVGPVTGRELLARIGLPQLIFDASYTSLAAMCSPEIARSLSAPPSAEIEQRIELSLDWLQSSAVNGILTLPDADYPAELLSIPDAPFLLYYAGQIETLKKPKLAIVGSRHSTAGGNDNARAFARYFAAKSWAVVSGLAYGIDKAAHEGALASAQPAATIAVMATGLDLVYPGEHIELAVRVRDQGLLLSEYGIGMQANTHHFPQRNRIVAGLSLGVLVVEAAKRSGSLITAKQALEYSREVFAIPGSIHSQLARGCHQLIREGAKLVERAADIEEELRAAYRIPD
ncbi:DNA-processing protein DprA [Oligella urethralis]|uniref:DNA-processing protein DprA n=1 Tax=Oligella urethralis TaxID=90245 RepID=UPI001FD483A6|nr:DNA-processing protein DprA [Oligella urethralis]